MLLLKKNDVIASNNQNHSIEEDVQEDTQYMTIHNVKI
jgi:hypothetical protein